MKEKVAIKKLVLSLGERQQNRCSGTAASISPGAETISIVPLPLAAVLDRGLDDNEMLPSFIDDLRRKKAPASRPPQGALT
jgi:hypothetical protein